MILTIDTVARRLVCESVSETRELELYTSEAFEILSHVWLKVGWNQKYTYTFTWLGRPLVQLPDDMIRIQEVIYQVQPDVIIETGVAHGGSLVFYASLCRAMERGRVIGVDIEIRPPNRQAIQQHELSSLITLIEGSSIDSATLCAVAAQVKPGERILVILDSCHTKEHVQGELEAYHSLVTTGSYIVATDGFMAHLSDVPRGREEWSFDNPAAAAREFAQRHPEFILEEPAWSFNESALRRNVTHWPSAWLRRK